MFSVDHSFHQTSLTMLSLASTPDAVADACITLLKNRNILKLSCHEWVGWLKQTKDYLETGLKVSEKGQSILALLKAELDFRQTDYHLPLITAYGKVASGNIIPPSLRLVSQHRIEWGLIQRFEKNEEWDDNWDVASVLREKKDHLDQSMYSVLPPASYAKRALNVSKPETTQIESAKEADAIVHYLHKMFPWKDGINCEYRALAAKEFVEAISVDPKTLKIVRVGNKGNPGFGPYNWSYHEVLGIETKNDGFFILDPKIDETKALTVKEWKGLIGAADYGVGVFEKSDCDESAAYAVATHTRFPGMSAITSKDTHPTLHNLLQPYADK